MHIGSRKILLLIIKNTHFMKMPIIIATYIVALACYSNTPKGTPSTVANDTIATHEWNAKQVDKPEPAPTDDASPGTIHAAQQLSAPEEPAATAIRSEKQLREVDNAVVNIQINVVEEAMKYDNESFTVKAGDQVIIDFYNPDSMPHNLVFGKAGSYDRLSAAATKMAMDPKGAEKNYIPESTDIFAATPLIGPDEIYTLEFVAPEEPGDYPYICTVPGHWTMMKGVMKVVAK